MIPIDEQGPGDEGGLSSVGATGSGFGSPTRTTTSTGSGSSSSGSGSSSTTGSDDVGRIADLIAEIYRQGTGTSGGDIQVVPVAPDTGGGGMSKATKIIIAVAVIGAAVWYYRKHQAGAAGS